MVKWEYLQHTTSGNHFPHEICDLGREGWEMTGIMGELPHAKFYFKRPVEEENPCTHQMIWSEGTPPYCSKCGWKEEELGKCETCKFLEHFMCHHIGHIYCGQHPRVGLGDGCDRYQKKEPEPTLKPCPFCREVTDVTIMKDNPATGDVFWNVHCYTCGATTESQYTKQEAIEAWNRRA